MKLNIDNAQKTTLVIQGQIKHIFLKALRESIGKDLIAIETTTPQFFTDPSKDDEYILSAPVKIISKHQEVIDKLELKIVEIKKKIELLQEMINKNGRRT